MTSGFNAFPNVIHHLELVKMIYKTKENINLVCAVKNYSWTKVIPLPRIWAKELWRINTAITEEACMSPRNPGYIPESDSSPSHHTLCSASVSVQREWNLYKVILSLHRLVC